MPPCPPTNVSSSCPTEFAMNLPAITAATRASKSYRVELISRSSILRHKSAVRMHPAFRTMIDPGSCSRR